MQEVGSTSRHVRSQPPRYGQAPVPTTIGHPPTPPVAAAFTDKRTYRQLVPAQLPRQAAAASQRRSRGASLSV